MFRLSRASLFGAISNSRAMTRGAAQATLAGLRRANSSQLSTWHLVVPYYLARLKSYSRLLARRDQKGQETEIFSERVDMEF